MKLARGPIPIDIARELAEEALIAAARKADAELQQTFREEKEAIHSIEIIDIREERIDALDCHWMEQFRVSESIEAVLARHPGVEEAISYCELRLARSKEEERAFLYAPDTVEKATLPMLVVQLMAETLLELERLEALLTTPLVTARRSVP